MEDGPNRPCSCMRWPSSRPAGHRMAMATPDTPTNRPRLRQRSRALGDPGMVQKTIEPDAHGMTCPGGAASILHRIPAVTRRQRVKDSKPGERASTQTAVYTAIERFYNISTPVRLPTIDGPAPDRSAGEQVGQSDRVAAPKNVSSLSTNRISKRTDIVTLRFYPGRISLPPGRRNV